MVTADSPVDVRGSYPDVTGMLVLIGELPSTTPVDFGVFSFASRTTRDLLSLKITVTSSPPRGVTSTTFLLNF